MPFNGVLTPGLRALDHPRGLPPRWGEERHQAPWSPWCHPSGWGWGHNSGCGYKAPPPPDGDPRDHMQGPNRTRRRAQDRDGGRRMPGFHSQCWERGRVTAQLCDSVSPPAFVELDWKGFGAVAGATGALILAGGGPGQPLAGRGTGGMTQMKLAVIGQPRPFFWALHDLRMGRSSSRRGNRARPQEGWGGKSAPQPLANACPPSFRIPITLALAECGRGGLRGAAVAQGGNPGPQRAPAQRRKIGPNPTAGSEGPLEQAAGGGGGWCWGLGSGRKDCLQGALAKPKLPAPIQGEILWPGKPGG